MGVAGGSLVKESENELNRLLKAANVGCRELRWAAIEVACRAANTDCGLFFNLVKYNDRVFYSHVEPSPGCERLQFIRQFEGWEFLDLALMDPGTPESGDIGKFTATGSIQQIQNSHIYRQMAKPSGVIDVARLIAYHDNHFAGWLGVFRFEGQKPFSRSDLGRLSGITDLVASALEKACDLQGRAAGQHPIYLVTDEKGICVENTAPKVVERLYTKEVVARVASAISSGAFCTDGQPGFMFQHQVLKVLPMKGSAARRYLVQLKQGEPVVMSPFTVLTQMQRKVAELIAEGRTSASTANELGISEETVKSHLRLIYRRLGVSSRVELVKIFSFVNRQLSAKTERLKKSNRS
jgi:DNA-binding CsgD family transcriptional regulator